MPLVGDGNYGECSEPAQWGVTEGHEEHEDNSPRRAFEAVYRETIISRWHHMVQSCRELVAGKRDN